LVYEYQCNECDSRVDVIKSVREIDKKESCKTCGTIMTRAFAPRKIHLSGTAVQEKKWQPSLGRPATDNEMKQAAKDKGWIELGSERPEKHLAPPDAEYPSFSNDDLAALARKE
jgi:putative FmdB family regulatory protein